MRILLAEDNVDLATWLAKALRQRGYAVDHMADGAAADQVLATEQYDVALLDVNLPRMDGFDVLRRLRARGSALPVLMLTARGDLEDRVQGLNLGADDYLVKPFELAELEARVKALIRRSQSAGSPTVTLGSLEYDSAQRTFRAGGALLTLRPREHAVLEVLMLRAGKAVSKDALFEKVFALDAETNPDAVEIYISRLRKRLEGSGAQIVTLRGLGYVLEAAP